MLTAPGACPHSHLPPARRARGPDRRRSQTPWNAVSAMRNGSMDALTTLSLVWLYRNRVTKRFGLASPSSSLTSVLLRFQQRLDQQRLSRVLERNSLKGLLQRLFRGSKVKEDLLVRLPKRAQAAAGLWPITIPPPSDLQNPEPQERSGDVNDCDGPSVQQHQHSHRHHVHRHHRRHHQHNPHNPHDPIIIFFFVNIIIATLIVVTLATINIQLCIAVVVVALINIQLSIVVTIITTHHHHQQQHSWSTATAASSS